MATQFDPIAKDESLNTTEATPRNIADVIAEGLKGIEDALPTYTEGDGIDISAQKEISVDTTFTEASTRANIASGDLLSTILGKIKKYFTDLKAVAFSGAAADVTYGSGSVKDALDVKQVSKIYDVSSSTFSTLTYFGNTAYLGSVVPETSLYGKVSSFSARTTSQYPCVCSMTSNGNINFISSVNADVQVRIVYDGRLTIV